MASAGLMAHRDLPRQRLSFSGCGIEQLGSAVGTGQHQHTARTGVDRPCNVGVRPVPDEQRVMSAESADRVVSERPMGFPAASGSASTAIRTAATAAPLPGTSPRSVGRIGSMFVATQCAP